MKNPPHVIICVCKGWSNNDPDAFGLQAMIDACPDLSRILVLHSAPEAHLQGLIEQPIRPARFESWDRRPLNIQDWDYCIVMHPYPPASVRSMMIARAVQEAGGQVIIVRRPVDAKPWKFQGLPKEVHQ